MARTAKAAATTEKPVVEATDKPVECEVKDFLKSHSSIMLGTRFIPIVDGKVKISSKTKEIFEKSGCLT